ncbi:DNA-binding MarR family transcriptional regulator [Leucobacter exalbidus]|uniref:DNA-binding MarR family transcriptional regulator n=1 Tax=Leucobacter exalbidus TaxID=662960 RepID=A0A940T049_9MICO|nr:MarR family winged helix-turn-helix transcriptional regulator [Leucobacter exalbidus]MBP1325560.1 DNA-binding MarR family transcriptional regulator [Leucobacter exalbidus]
MTDETIASIEYEALVFSRHLSGLPGHARRSRGTLDHSAYTLLNLLEVGGPATISELAGITDLDASTLSRQTAALLRDGLASRVANPEGGVARKFEITEQGRVAVTEERDASRAVLASIIGDWSAPNRESFAELLSQFNRAIEARSGRSWPRA